MDTNTAQALALSLMSKHGIDLQGWQFAFDNGKQRFGCTHFGTRKITLSRPLTRLNSSEEVRGVILHEIAHVLAGHQAGHGLAWRAVVRRIGGSASRTHSAQTVQGRYQATCANCGRTHYRHRKTAQMLTSACGTCCKRYNGGRHDPKYTLSWVDTGVRAA